MLVKPPPPVRSHFFVPAPDVRLDYERMREFERLCTVAYQLPPGSLLDYDCRFPKYEFLYYLTRHKRVVLHGSTQPGIEVFKPLHASQTSNLIAMYATADEVWATFSAVKSGNALTINGFFWATDDHGKARKLYDFAFNPGAAGGTHWVTGVVYVLPQSSFETWGHDWVSKHAVRPVLCLPVVPEDIPFFATLDRVTDKRVGEASFRIMASDHPPNQALPSLTS